MKETQVWFLGWADPLEDGMATHSNILAWRDPWTEEPGGLQSTGSQVFIENKIVIEAEIAHSLREFTTF